MEREFIRAPSSAIFKLDEERSSDQEIAKADVIFTAPVANTCEEAVTNVKE